MPEALSVEEARAQGIQKPSPTPASEPEECCLPMDQDDDGDDDNAVSSFVLGNDDWGSGAVMQSPVQRVSNEEDGKRTRDMRRCRSCGQQYSYDVWRAWHTAGQGFGRGRLKPHQVCMVPAELREPGFPLLQGQSMPRSKKRKTKR